MYSIYTDGSNDKDIKVGWGFLVVKDNKVIHENYGLANPKYNSSRNINGEIQAVMEAINWCVTNNISEINIFHDYNGISKWANGEWVTNKDITKKFKEFIDGLVNIKINWYHVKGHSGNEYNDRADKLALQGRS